MFSIIFPGQGSQIIGMAREFYDNFGYVKDYFKQADEILNKKLSKIVLEGPKESLDLTENTQPAIMTIGVSIFNVLKSEYGLNLNESTFFAGHSLGEYTALVCGGSLSLEQAAYLLNERGKSMQASVVEKEGAMLAILGMNISEVENEINSFSKDGVCEISNDNSNSQIVISGDKKTIEKSLGKVNEN